MKLRHSDITSIANGRAFSKMIVWTLVWSISWLVAVALIAYLVDCPTGCWLTFVLLLGWFAGMMYKFLRVAKTLKTALYKEIETEPTIDLEALKMVQRDKNDTI